MPAHEEHQRFLRDIERLTAAQRRQFGLVLRAFVTDLRDGSFRPSLRVKRVVMQPGVWEMSWAADGWATFRYGPERIPGEHHVIWLRIGTHEIFREP